MATITELSCPYCGKVVSIEEYEQALEKVRIKIEKESMEQLEKEKEQRRKDKEIYEESIRWLKEQQQIENNNIEKKIREEITSKYSHENENLKKSINELDVKRQKELAEYEEELYTRDLYFRKELQSVKAQTIEYAKVAAQDEIDGEKSKTRELEIQINRFKDEVDILKKQLSQSQSELKGEVGELNLLDKLKDVFPTDLIERSCRGTESADIIHKIKLKSGNIIDTSIIYDNKNANAVTSKDIEKAKRYMKIHDTEYIIIVSQNLSKRDIKNGRIGVKEGILLVHPSIVTDLVQVIRKEIINISKLIASNKSQQTKQSILYDYIMSREFNNLIEIIYDIYESSVKLLNEEEKSHKIIWNKRRTYYEKMKNVHLGLSSKIDSITQDSIPQLQLENEILEQER